MLAVHHSRQCAMKSLAIQFIEIDSPIEPCRGHASLELNLMGIQARDRYPCGTVLIPFAFGDSGILLSQQNVSRVDVRKELLEVVSI